MIQLALSVALLFTATSASSNSVLVSWYEHGYRTASGERFNPDGLTAAHRTLPFGSLVTFKHKDRQVTVRVNDRGPFKKGRLFDLSRGAAKRLGVTGVQPIDLIKIKVAKR